MADESRTTGMGLWTDASEMLQAAKHLSTVKKMELSQPLYYLLGHGLELGFKSFLRAKGAGLPALKKIGHDLVVGMDLAIAAGLTDLVAISELDKGGLNNQVQHRNVGGTERCCDGQEIRTFESGRASGVDADAG